MRRCCCNAASGLASPEAEAARRVRSDVTTAPNVGAGLAGCDEDPVPPPPPPPPPPLPPLPAPAPLAEANRPAASEVHDAGVAGCDDDDEGEGEDGAYTCRWESSCTARLSAATSCSRSSRSRCLRRTRARRAPRLALWPGWRSRLARRAASRTRARCVPRLRYASRVRRACPCR